MALVEISKPDTLETFAQTFSRPNISGTIVYPKKRITVEEMATMGILRQNGRRADEAYIRHTIGTISRTVADPDTTNFSLLTKAPRSIGLDPARIGAVLVSSSYPDNFDTATMYAESLKSGMIPYAKNFHAACAGFTLMLLHLQSWMNKNPKLDVVVAAAEIYSPHLEPLSDPEGAQKDPSLAEFIFGDGGITLSFNQSGLRILYSDFTPNAIPGTEQLITMPVDEAKTINAEIKHVESGGQNRFKQNGGEVYKKVLDTIPEAIALAIEKSGVDKGKIKGVIPHQGSRRMSTALAGKIPYATFVNPYHGNWSSASIPKLFIEALATGQVDNNDIIVLAGFGAGMYIGISIVQIGKHVF